jgi:hypothetical protein
MKKPFSEDLEKTLSGLLEGLSNLEKALILVEAFREVYGNEWTIKAHAEGGFTIDQSGLAPVNNPKK